MTCITNAVSGREYFMIQKDKVRGTLLGTAIGDALGMPIEGLSHQNVRTYYKGIKEYRSDDQRKDLKEGQWTDDTQFCFALARALQKNGQTPELLQRVADEYVALRAQARRWGPTTTAAVDQLAKGVSYKESGNDEHPTNGAAMRAAPLGAWWASREFNKDEAFSLISQVLQITHRHSCALVAGMGQAFAVKQVLQASPEDFSGKEFFQQVLAFTQWVEAKFDNADTRNSSRLKRLAGALNGYPLDLAEVCEGTGVSAHESWPYAVAMMARGPHLVEATLLSGINVGGDADTTGAMMGMLLGGLHGWTAFPEEWQQGLEDAEQLLVQADTLAAALQ